MAFENNRANRLAIATLKDDVSLADGIRTALESLKADGSYQAILKTWGVAPVDDFTMNPGH